MSVAPAYRNVLVGSEHGMARITLNRPEAYNALNLALAWASTKLWIIWALAVWEPSTGPPTPSLGGRSR